MAITESTLAHVGKLYGALGACVHEPIAAQRVKLGSGDNLSQLLHVCRLDVDNVKALILDIQIPEVDAEVVRADKRLAVAVDGYAVDMIGVGIGVRSARYGGNDGVMMGQAGHDEVFRVLEAMRR